MKARPFILSLLLVFVAAPSLRAQWSGSLNFSTGLGGMTGNNELEVGMLGHLLTQGNVSVQYQTDKFSWKTDACSSWASNGTFSGIYLAFLGIYL